jgi:hypothetical protein
VQHVDLAWLSWILLDDGGMAEHEVSEALVQAFGQHRCTLIRTGGVLKPYLHDRRRTPMSFRSRAGL